MPVPDSPRSSSRRAVLRSLGVGAAGVALSGCGTGALAWGGRLPPEPPPRPPAPPVGPVPTPAEAEVRPLPRAEPAPLVTPPRPHRLPTGLPRGGTVALVAPAGVLRSSAQVADASERLRALGFEVVVGRHVLARRGFLAGTDAQRAADLMRMVEDPDVDAIVAMRGGWGCARILPLLDYDAIAANPKPIVGYSDITALLVAIWARTGLVTFHGPVGVTTWGETVARSFVRSVVDGEPIPLGPETRAERDRTQTVVGGVATGPFVGGNLSVLAALAGTGYLPSTDGAVVFFEEVGEDAYRVDRLLVQLELAGFLRDPAAVVFGQCSRCSSGGSSWSAERTIREHLRGYDCPSIVGAPIGHASPVYTLPVGLPARVDADAGTVRFLGPAVA